MRCIFNHRCCIIQGGTQLQGYASRYADANVFRRLEQCHLRQELLSLAALANGACPRTLRTLSNDKGTFVYLNESCGEAHAISRELVGLF